MPNMVRDFFRFAKLNPSFKENKIGYNQWGNPMQDEEIVQNIDTTLDQLIRNAEAFSKAELKDLTEIELDAFQKTQESLLQHLLQMDQMLIKKPQDKRSATFQLREKRERLEKLKSQYSKSLETTLQERRPFLSKRRTKRFFEFR